LNSKERELISKRLTSEVYEEQLTKLQKSSVDDTTDNRLAIERFQQDLKQLAKELPRLKFQIDTLQTRINAFNQRKTDLIDMRKELKKFEHETQMIFEEKILKENHLNRMKNCRDLIRNIHKCRTTDDLPQKIFYDLPVKCKENEEGKNKKLFFMRKKKNKF